MDKACKTKVCKNKIQHFLLLANLNNVLLNVVLIIIHAQNLHRNVYNLIIVCLNIANLDAVKIIKFVEVINFVKRLNKLLIL